MQYNREADGVLKPLPAKHIDTGMGLERLVSILQGVNSNYDTDVFKPLFDAIHSIVGGAPYSGKLGDADAQQDFRDTAYRVVADHIRTLSFAIADGAVPSNEGRGYVLRRVLRRAIRYGMQTLGAKPGFLVELVPTLVAHMRDAFPELEVKQGAIEAIIAEEEASFSTLLDRGIKFLSSEVEKAHAAGQDKLSGDTAFYLYDTLGFPLDLTEIMAGELGVGVDIEGFASAMSVQRARSREATRSKALAGRQGIALGVDETAFLKDGGVLATDDSPKYLWDTVVDTSVVAIFYGKSFVDELDISSVAADATVGVVLESSPFYAEAGGQVADTGSLSVNGIVLDVIDVQSYAGYVLHVCVPAEMVSGSVRTGDATVAAVNYPRRYKVAPNHTMTHVLNHALRDVLGGDVDQKGSLVTDEKFRFDFSHGNAVTSSQLAQIEARVEDVIAAELPVDAKVVALADAQEIFGLRAVFGETYPDPVRVISVGAPVESLLNDRGNPAWGDLSVEFCGGTHLGNTREAEGFVITEETAVAKGIRRVSGVTGALAREAKARAVGLEAEASSVQARVAAASASATVPATSEVDGADADVVALKVSLDELVLPQAVKSELRSRLDAAQKELVGIRNRVRTAAVDAGVRAAKERAAQVAAAGGTVVVLEVSIGADAKGVKRAIDEISKAAPGVAFMGISPSDEADKLLCFSYVPEGHPGLGDGSVLRANDWLSSTLSACGGRGGGKPKMAQGSAAGVAQLSAAMAAAEAFAEVY